MPDSDINGEPVSRESDVLGLGERLRSARKARAMSLAQVSEALHLDESILLALEEERFDSLGAPVFVKGHLKSYAQLVGLSVDAVLAHYHESDASSSMPPKLAYNVDRSVTINPVTWGFYASVIFLALALVIYVFQGEDEVPVSLERNDDSAELQLPVGTETAEPRLPDMSESESVVLPDQPIPEVSIGSDGEELTDSIAVEDVAGAELPNNRLVNLGLYFHKEAWVEISDVERRLLFGLQKEGMRRDLSGEPPIRLLLGNSDSVDLFLNDEPYPVPQDRVNGKVARFIIDPPLEN
jgi:cytoskeleton protein RodZ